MPRPPGRRLPGAPASVAPRGGQPPTHTRSPQSCASFAVSLTLTTSSRAGPPSSSLWVCRRLCVLPEPWGGTLGSCFRPVTSWSPVLGLPMQPTCPGSSLSVLTPAYNRSVSLSSPSPPTYPPKARSKTFCPNKQTQFPESAASNPFVALHGPSKVWAPHWPHMDAPRRHEGSPRTAHQPHFPLKPSRP